MESVNEELNILEIRCENIKEYIFGEIFGVKFCVINDENNKINDYFVNQNIIPIKINQIDNEYYLINCISKKDYRWKRQYDKLNKHLSFCECIFCLDKRKIKNEIFYIIAESLFI